MHGTVFLRLSAVCLGVLCWMARPGFAQIPTAPNVEKPTGVAQPALAPDPSNPVAAKEAFPPLRKAGSATEQNQPATVNSEPAQPSHAEPVQPMQPGHAEGAQPTQPSHAEGATPTQPGHAEPAQPTQPPQAEPSHAERLHAGVSHAAQATHAGGVHHEAGPVIENWISFDYGPGKTHHHPPFLFALLNFAAFVFVLGKYAGKPFKEFMATRHLEVRKALDRARDLENQARERLLEYQKKTDEMQAEIDALLQSMAGQAQLERQKIIARAEAEAEKLLKDAEMQVQQTIESAKRDLERKTALLAVDLAEKLMESRMSDLDQRNLVQRFVGQIEAQTSTGGRAC